MIPHANPQQDGGVPAGFTTHAETKLVAADGGAILNDIECFSKLLSLFYQLKMPKFLIHDMISYDCYV